MTILEDFFLSSFREHGLKIASSTVGFLIVYLAVVKFFGRQESFIKLEKKDQNLITTSVVGEVHALIALSLAIPCILNPPQELVDNPFWGVSSWVCTVFSLSCGYFLWDFLICCYQRWSKELIAHGFLCFCVYFLCLKCHQTYSLFFLFFELSTVFLNARPVLKHAKIGAPVSTVFDALFALVSAAPFFLQYGGLGMGCHVLVQAFLFSRILCGLPVSFYFQRDVVNTLANGTYTYLQPIIFLSLANVILCSLNVYWFYLIILKFKRSLSGKKKE